MKSNIADKTKREIERLAREIKFIVEVFLGGATIVGIWTILDLTTTYSALLSITLVIFLAVEAVPFIFDLMHLSGKK